MSYKEWFWKMFLRNLNLTISLKLTEHTQTKQANNKKTENGERKSFLPILLASFGGVFNSDASL